MTTFGSFGDLHPYVAVGKGLLARGHAVTLATSEFYRAKVEGEGLRFHPLRPDLAELRTQAEFMRRVMHPRKGTEYILRHIFIPRVEDTYEDTIAAARDADLIVGHPIAYATPIAAEAARKPWVSVALAPLSLLSAYEAPAISGAGWLNIFSGAGPGFWRMFWKTASRASQRWGDPIYRLREKLGLPRGENPVLQGTFSPFATQAWFSKVLAKPQPDWPANTVVTGFPFYDRLEAGSEMNDDLRRFLAAGPAPVVFTLGTSAVFDAGTFYAESAEAARLAGCRAVLVVGTDPRNRPAGRVAESVHVAEYAPYSELFAHAAAIVHQGGIGTTGQALRSGRPMIVVPFSHDQPDNAERVARLGVGRVVPRGRYRADRVAAELAALPMMAAQAARVGEIVRSEDGVAAACDGLEAICRRLLPPY